MYWNIPVSSSDFETSDEYRKERNIRDFAMGVTGSLDSVVSNLSSIEASLTNLVNAVNGTGSSLSVPLQTIAGAVGADNEGTTVLEKAYAAVVIREHHQTVKKIRQALAGATGAEGEEENELRALRETLQAILGDE